MKTFVVALILTVCAAAQAASIGKSPAITPLEYYQTNRDVGRIISGEPATQGQFPWQVALITSLPEGLNLCGGSLISPGWVLTAGHCVDGGISWSVKVGGIYRNVSNEPGSVTVSSKDGIVHEDYSLLPLKNDIALVKLSEEVPLSENIQLIRLPALSEVDDPLENIPVTVSGWGNTGKDWGGPSEDLNWVNLTTIANDACANIYGPTIVESVICCIGKTTQSTCHGDSGGALIRIAADGKPTQVGVVSFIHHVGCTRGYPVGFTRTASFLKWIHEKTGIPIRE